MTSISDNLVSLRHPINFASANSTFWPEIAEGRTLDLTESDLAERPIGSFEAWIQYTVFHFAKAGVPFTVSKNPIVGTINFVDTRSYGIRNYNPLAFTTALRGDTQHSKIAHYSLEQNLTRAAKPNAGFAKIWPQPGLPPRDPARGDMIRVIGYRGVPKNLEENFRSPAFCDALRERGIELSWNVNDHKGAYPFYSDYSEVDLTLSIRNMTLTNAAGKPASKLVNSWIAGAPALLGPEPAFFELQEDELDFLVVRKPEDALNAVDHLLANPGIYRQMRERCRDRAFAHTAPSVVAKWVAQINGDLGAYYEKWLQKSAIVTV